MPSLDNHQSNSVTKVLLIGDAKSGKTGSLVSLVKAGYKLRILDYDNLLDILKYMILDRCPEMISNVEFRTLRDHRKAGPLGVVIDGQPKAFLEGTKMLSSWKYKDGETVIDLGDPAKWGPDCVLVIDSLSRLCDAAYDFAETLTPKGAGGVADGRAIYGTAQDLVEAMLADITNANYNTNLIMIAHGQYMDLPDGGKKIFPQGVGQKLSPKIPQYFPTYIRYRNQGGKRTIQTVSDALIDLANTRPMIVNKEYPIETGLAEIFAALRSTAPVADKPKPAIVKRA